MGVVGNLFRKMTFPDFVVSKTVPDFSKQHIKIRKGNQ